MLVVNNKIRIPLSEFEFKYMRSSGKGGQNVNKVNSKAVLYWNPCSSHAITNDVRERFLDKFKNRLSNEFILQIQSERFRDQARNVQDCFDKLKSMLLSVAIPPKKRKPTRPTRSSKLKRLDSKRRHSEKKQSRSGNY